MADSYDAYSQELDKQKAGLLASIAQYGTAGRQEYERTQAALTQQKQTAVKAAIDDAIRRGANPTGDFSGIEHTISDPYDQRIASITASMGQQANSFNSMAANNSAYFDSAKAGIPALRTYAQAKSGKDALDNQYKQLQIRKLEQDLAGGPGDSLIPSLNKAFGGVSGGNRALLAAAKEYVTAHGGNWGHTGTSAFMEKFDEENGLPKGYTRSLLKPAKSATPAKPTAQARRTQTASAVAKKHGTDSKTFRAFTYIAEDAKNFADAMAGLNDLYDNADELVTTGSGKKKGTLNKTLLTTYLRSYFS